MRSRAYGPRKLRLWSIEADLCEAKGDRAAAAGALREARDFAKTLPLSGTYPKLLEAIEKVGTVRERCGDLCPHAPARDGKVERVFSSPRIRGDGREAKESTISPGKRSNRPGGADDCGDDH